MVRLAHTLAVNTQPWENKREDPGREFPRDPRVEVQV